MLSSRSSATVVCQPTARPSSASRRLSHWALVSRFCPLVSSLPTEMISAFMRDSLHEPALGLELLLPLGPLLAQVLSHGPVGERGRVPQGALRLQPRRHVRVGGLQTL